MKDDGGPAFPTTQVFDEWSEDKGQYVKRSYGVDGMSLRDYFAAHAPRKPQAWFAPSMPPYPAPIYDHDHDLETVGCYGFDGFQTCAPTNADERKAWRDENDKQFFVQWPYAWADAMLKAREA